MGEYQRIYKICSPAFKGFKHAFNVVNGSESPDIFNGNPKSGWCHACKRSRSNEGSGSKEKQELLQLSQEVTTELSLKNNMNVLSEIGITKMIVEELVSNHKADMVILNSEPDASFWEQSVTNKDIIYDINCPVWVIPEKTEYVPYSKVVYATNYKEEDIS